MTHFNLEAIVRPNILALKPYRCARDDYSEGILLDANENAFGPCLVNGGTSLNLPDPVLHSDFHLERYPDPHQSLIKARLVELKDIPSPENIFLGVGSDECIDLALRIFCTPGQDKVLICPPTYGMYSVSSQINDVQVVKVPLIVVEKDRFQLDIPLIKETLVKEPRVKILFLCSPGNPTGTLLKLDDIKALLEFKDYKGIVLVDEAYIDFCDKSFSAVNWISQYPNLMVIQTLSKAYGLAGIRLGISVASKEITQLMNNTKAPYNISTPTSLIAKSALSPVSIANMANLIANIMQQREVLLKDLQSLVRIGNILGGNHANFVLAEILSSEGHPCNATAQSVYKKLAEDFGIVVRYRGTELGCTGCLRITVGTADENQMLIQKLRTLLE